jgi:hypothetical protein
MEEKRKRRMESLQSTGISKRLKFVWGQRPGRSISRAIALWKLCSMKKGWLGYRVYKAVCKGNYSLASLLKWYLEIVQCSVQYQII